MKKIALLTAIIMIFASTNLCFASSVQYTEYAENLSKIGVFKGTGSGYELDRAPTRIEGIIMLIRLLGKEDEALMEPEEASVFNDVPTWAIKYTNYAYKKGLTNGIGNYLFGSDMQMSSNAYYTYLLRALGYNDAEGDFSWDKSLDFAHDSGMVSDALYNSIEGNAFLRDHVAKSSYETLYTNVKGESTTLIDKLIESGDINSEIAKTMSITEEPVQIDLEKYNFDNLTYSFDWKEDTDSDVSAIGYCRISFESEQRESEIKKALIAGWYMEEPDLATIADMIDKMTAIWKMNGLSFGEYDYTISQSFPVYKKDLGESLYVVVTLLDENVDAQGYILVPVDVPSSVQ